MAVTALPVVVVASGGLAVVQVTTAPAIGALPATVVTALGLPITLVSALGLPMTLMNPDGSEYEP
jgi:hypothetical protein